MKHVTRGVRTGAAAAVVALIGAAVTLGMPSPASAHVTSVGGGAFGAQVGVTVLIPPPVTLGPVPAVTLPSGGGAPLTATLASINVAGLLTTGVLDVSTSGGNLDSHDGFATSTAQVAGVAALVDVLTADVVSSTCTSNGDGSSGSTTLAGASIKGLGALDVNPAPNTTIPVLGVGSIILNEQTQTNVVGSTSSITVTAIHVHIDAVLLQGDIYIAQSRCQVNGPDVLIDPDPPVDPTDPTDPGATDPGTTPSGPGTTPTDPNTPAIAVPATPRFTG